MTGFRPRETGTYQNDPFRLKMNSLAEYLKNAGYHTGAVVSNYVLRKGRNHEHGFDHFDDLMDDFSARFLIRKYLFGAGFRALGLASSLHPVLHMTYDNMKSSIADSGFEIERELGLWVHPYLGGLSLDGLDFPLQKKFRLNRI